MTGELRADLFQDLLLRWTMLDSERGPSAVCSVSLQPL